MESEGPDCQPLSASLAYWLQVAERWRNSTCTAVREGYEISFKVLVSVFVEARLCISNPLKGPPTLWADTFQAIHYQLQTWLARL